MVKRRVHVYISGKVQGVFFRSFIKEKADELEIMGLTRNTADNKVEAVLEGETRRINKMLDLCKKGPRFAKVDGLKVVEEDYKGEFTNFAILR